MADENGFSQWAILELMGHRKLAGMVQEVTMFGGALLRIDIYPGELVEPIMTQFYGSSSVYCLTPTTENIARDFARNAAPRPVTTWELSSVASGGRVRELDDDEDDGL